MLPSGPPRSGAQELLGIDGGTRGRPAVVLGHELQVRQESHLIGARQTLEPVQVAVAVAQAQGEGGAVPGPAPPPEFPSSACTSARRGHRPSVTSRMMAVAASAICAGVAPAVRRWL